MAGEKTEKASPKRKQDERKKGNVFKSNDIVSAASILIIFFVFKLLAPIILNYIEDMMQVQIMNISKYQSISIMDAQKIIAEALMYCGILFLPIALTAMVVGIIASGVQTKFLFSMESMKPKFGKLNPLKGIKNMFSMRSIVELTKNLLKVTVIGYVVYKNIISKFYYLPKTMTIDILQGMTFIASAIWDIVVNISIIFIFIAVADFGYQWWEYEKNLKMSKQEIKEEYKQMEGDPHIKGKIKEKQRAIAMNRMMSDVPKADVVIKNPTHFAVAIKYDSEKNNAPVVLAKGQDRVAFKIIDIAEKNNVITIENVPLARALYAKVEIGQEIPPDFYQPVSEVLAYVYKLNKKEL